MTQLQPHTPELPPEVYEPLPVETAWQEPMPRPGRSVVGRVLGALFRYRWVLLTALVLGGAGAAVTWRTVKLDYLAQGSLWMNQTDARAMGGPITEGGLLESFAWLDLIRSFSVLDPVVIDQRLYLEYDPADAELFQTLGVTEGKVRPGAYELRVATDGSSYILRTGTGLTVESGAPGDSVGRPLGFAWKPPAAEFEPERSAKFVIRSPRDAAVRLRESIETRMDPLATFIQLGFRSPDPERAAGVLQSVMRRSVDVARDLKRSKLDATNQVLAEQLNVVESDLKNAEQELEGFRVQTITLPTDQAPAIAPGLQQTQAPVLNEFFQLRLDLEDAQRDRQALEAVLASRQDSTAELRVTALELVPAARQSSQLTGYLTALATARSDLRTLEERYTEEYQPVREARARVLELERVTIPRAIEGIVAELRSREDQLTRAIGTRAGELEDIPPRMIEEARLERRVEIATRLYTELRQRYETSSLASRSSVPDVQILDLPKVPTEPEGDKRIRFALMVFGAVFGCGVGLVLLLDRMDPKLHDPFDVTGELGLPILGAVPHLKESAPESESQVREAFRELRINVEYAHGPVRPLVICVTSPSEKEGKSFVSANLAIAFAGLKRRTLLVDGDTRRGNAHDLFGAERKPGLTDFLMTNHGTPAHVQRSGHDNLWLLSSGSRHAASPELLNSGHMQSLMAAAKKRFDVVILDSPPLSAGADALMLAAHAGSLVVVVRSGTTNKALTMVKLEPLLRLPVRILGAVINDFSNTRLYGSYRYYGDYLPGYQAKDEAPERLAPAGSPAPPALTP